jgi:probable F420-dependent oxidoreductase
LTGNHDTLSGYRKEKVFTMSAVSTQPESGNHPFHASIVQGGPPDGPALAELALRAEGLGFDALVIPDAAGHAPAVFPSLAWVAARTTTLQVGCHVLNNDLRHPLHVARDAATIHTLSGGRFILGIGAGRDRNGEDIRAYGIPVDPPGRRVSRLEEAVGIIGHLLDGEVVSTSGPNYTLEDAELRVPLPETGKPELLLAAGGPRMLAFGGRSADVVALGLNPLASFDEVRERVEIIREAAAKAGRNPAIAINLAGAGDTVHPWVQGRAGKPIDATITDDGPAFLMGDTHAIIAKLARMREELGITRIVLAPDFIDALTPVVRELK